MPDTSDRLIQKSPIGTFGSFQAPSPFPRESYNDDVAIPRNAGTSRTFAGKVWKGLHEEHIGSLSPLERAEEAINSHFPNRSKLHYRSHRRKPFTSSILPHWGDFILLGRTS